MGQIGNTDAELATNLAALRRQVAKVQPKSVLTEKAQDELRVFFAQSIDLLCIAGLDGYFKRINPAWEKQFGWTQEALFAKPVIDFIHPDDRDATLVEIDNLSNCKNRICFENRFRHKDGSYRWLRWEAESLSRRQLIYATARDITRQKRQEREILEILDQEKERLGQELHDGLCPTLAGIAALSAGLSRRLVANCDTETAALAREITGLLNETISDARNMARGLGPMGLSDIGLDGALHTLAENVEHMFRIPCTILSDQPFPRLDPTVEAHLFRIAQEAVHNTVTHAQANRIEISLSCENGICDLSVGDDGIGLLNEQHQSAGIGLHSMAYRARLIGASLEVRPGTVRGTSVNCTLPLPAQPVDQPHIKHSADH